MHSDHSSETHDMKFPGQSPSNVFRKCFDDVVLYAVAGEVQRSLLEPVTQEAVAETVA